MIEDIIIISTLTSAVVYLFYMTTKNNLIEQWSQNEHKKYESYDIKVNTTPQSRYIISNLKQRLLILFPPPYMLRKKFTGLLSVLNKRDIMSEIKLLEGSKSFTINKKEIYLCIKDKNSEKDNYYDYNSLIFVTLHEIAHVLCNELGHTEKFQLIFKELLKHASLLNLYDETKPFVNNYCPS